MCKILKLTLIDAFNDNTEEKEHMVYVNADNIVQFYNNNECNRTYMNLSNNITLYVKETPEEILSMIDGK